MRAPTDTIVFCSFDIVALIVQAVGGSKASQAVQTGRDPNPVRSNPLPRLAHLTPPWLHRRADASCWAGSRSNSVSSPSRRRDPRAFPFPRHRGSHACDCAAAVCVYLLLAAEFLVRYTYDRPVHTASPGALVPKRAAFDRGIKLMIVGLALDGLFILIRSIYRTIVSGPTRSHAINVLNHERRPGAERRLRRAYHPHASIFQSVSLSLYIPPGRANEMYPLTSWR